MKPKDLLNQADHLARLSPLRPKQANLRRGVSASYYAVFHALCESNANCLVGTSGSRPDRAWLQTYRSLDHKKAKSSCHTARSMTFPQEIKDFANSFISLQEERHRADYDPDASRNFSKQEVIALISTARLAVDALKRAPIVDRRAFAVYVLLQNRY